MSTPLIPSDDPELLARWQRCVDLMAKVIDVPAGLIMRLDGDDIVVFISSDSQGNPYKPGDHEYFADSGLYCETVINSGKVLMVQDALSDPDWKENPDVKLNMISYLGFPLLWPTGDPFGTICILDDKPNAYSEIYVALMREFRQLIENELALIYAHEQLREQLLNDAAFSDDAAPSKVTTICMDCNRVRNERGYWDRIDDFLRKILPGTLSHGMCPQCGSQTIQKMDKDLNPKA